LEGWTGYVLLQETRGPLLARRGLRDIFWVCNQGQRGGRAAERRPGPKEGRWRRLVAKSVHMYRARGGGKGVRMVLGVTRKVAVVVGKIMSVQRD
jgi:hypothetical protein